MRLDRTSFAKRLGGYTEATELAGAPILEGRLLRMVGLTLELKLARRHGQPLHGHQRRQLPPGAG